jgi:hypothetical protein
VNTRAAILVGKFGGSITVIGPDYKPVAFSPIQSSSFKWPLGLEQRRRQARERAEAGELWQEHGLMRPGWVPADRIAVQDHCRITAGQYRATVTDLGAGLYERLFRRPAGDRRLRARRAAARRRGASCSPHDRTESPGGPADVRWPASSQRRPSSIRMPRAVAQQHVRRCSQHGPVPDHLLGTVLRTHLPLRLRRRPCRAPAVVSMIRQESGGLSDLRRTGNTHIGAMPGGFRAITMAIKAR